jgi:hypothetical protein
MGIRFMKRSTEKRSDEELKFFTQELYMKFNSLDDDEACAADEEWETAIRDYQDYFASVSQRMPDDVKLLRSFCFHDADLIDPKNLFLSKLPESGLAGMVLRVEENVSRAYLILYLLVDDVRELPSPANWPYPDPPIQWLYDELDISEGRQGAFIHRIMLSDGRVVVVPFTNVRVQTISLRATSPQGLVVQSA